MRHVIDHVMGTYPYSRPVTLTEALLGAVGRSEPTVCVSTRPTTHFRTLFEMGPGASIMLSLRTLSRASSVDILYLPYASAHRFSWAVSRQGLPLSTDTSLSLIFGAEHESRIGGVQKSQPLELHGDSR